MQLLAIMQSLSVLAVANTAPLVGKNIFGNRFRLTVDCGLAFFDGRPVFGRSKTFRGIVLSLSILTAAAVAPIIGLQVKIGAVSAAVAMSGDLLSSFVKRRLNLPPSSRATGLDQIPESLLIVPSGIASTSPVKRNSQR